MREGTAQAVELPHHQAIARADIGEGLGAPAVVPHATGLVLKEMPGIHAGLDQRIALQVGRLTIVSLDTRIEPMSIAEKPLAACSRTLLQSDSVLRADDDGFLRGRQGEPARCRQTSVFRTGPFKAIYEDHRRRRSGRLRPRGPSTPQDARTTMDPCQAGWTLLANSLRQPPAA